MHAIDVNPQNFTAMDALERIHTEQGEFEARVGVKERRVIGRLNRAAMENVVYAPTGFFRGTPGKTSSSSSSLAMTLAANTASAPAWNQIR